MPKLEIELSCAIGVYQKVFIFSIEMKTVRQGCKVWLDHYNLPLMLD